MPGWPASHNCHPQAPHTNAFKKKLAKSYVFWTFCACHPTNANIRGGGRVGERACRGAFGPHIGVALAGLAGQPQLPPTSAAHKCFQKKNWQKAVCFGHFAFAIQQMVIYARGEGIGGRGRGPQPPERLCACQVSLRPKIGVRSARRAGRPSTTATHERRTQMVSKIN